LDSILHTHWQPDFEMVKSQGKSPAKPEILSPNPAILDSNGLAV
jgi:hypothetical protein